MATDRNVASGSKFCRACGGKTTPPVGGVTTCANRAADGTQKTPMDRCPNLTPENRDYCEQCGEEAHGPAPCPACKKPPLRG